jgi:RNA polymerase-binding transcription factor DksA
MRGDSGTTCERCGRPIDGDDRRRAVRIASGQMHQACYAEHWKQVMAMIAEAERDGRFSRRPQ